MWKELVGNSSNLKVSSVQLAFTGIDVAEAGQQSIEGFLNPLSTSKKRGRYPVTDTDVQAQDSREGIGGGQAIESRLLDNSTSHSPLSYACTRCGELIQLQTADHSDEDQEDLFLKAKVEHDDFHFAQDLAKEGKPRSIISVSKKTTPKPTKKRKLSPEPKGIERFFRK